MNDATRVSVPSVSERIDSGLETALAALKSTHALITGAPEPETPAVASKPVVPAKVVARKAGRRRGEELILTSVEERAQVARFLRLIRSNYWMSNFVKVMLRFDASSPDQVSIKEIQTQLNSAQELDNLVQRVQHIGHTGYWADHPAIAAIREEWDDVFDYRTNRTIDDLIDSAKGAVKR